MSNCQDCQEREQTSYRVVQTMSQRNTIPCEERLKGMIVTVVGSDNSYKQFMLKGGDPCVNTNWEPYGLSITDLKKYIGHETIFEEPESLVESLYLNTRFPNSIEGFRVTFVTLNTTFTKLSDSTWAITNNIRI